MYDSKFYHMENSSKEDKMRNIIKIKARNITDEQLDAIVENVNFDRQYMVICVHDMEAFLKNAHNETGESFEVNVTPIYGNLTPGLVTFEGDYEEPKADDIPTAFVKNARIRQNGKVFYEDSIFIYEDI